MNEIDALLAEVEATRSVPTPARRRAIRENAGVTLGRLASVLGVTPSTVCNWEAGRRRPRGVNARAYGEALRALEQVVAKGDRDD